MSDTNKSIYRVTINQNVLCQRWNFAIDITLKRYMHIG